MGRMVCMRKGQRGFTLVEMVVVVALFGILSLVLTQSIVSFYNFNAYTLAQAYQVSHVRDSMEQMVRDIREMTFADDGAFPLVIWQDDRIGFYSDIDRDASVEYIEYTLSSTTLTKSIFNATGTPPVYPATPESVTILSEYVQNDIQGLPVFEYYVADGTTATGATTVTDIRYVRVNVVVNIDPVRDPGEYMLRSSAALRNLKNVQ